LPVHDELSTDFTDYTDSKKEIGREKAQKAPKKFLIQDQLQRKPWALISFCAFAPFCGLMFLSV